VTRAGTVKGVLADVNIEGHVDLIISMVLATTWADLWRELGLSYMHFRDVGLDAKAKDAVIWQLCQSEEYVLITSNRNQDDADSLEATIRDRSTARSLPVLTIADPERVRNSREYAEEIVESLIGTLIDMDELRGAGRLYLP
jgi:hypothetical protein